jgi:hypothetical protein
MADKTYKPADLNKDGKVTPKERKRYQAALVEPPKADELSREELAAQYQSAVGIIYSVPEIKDLFEKALNEGWTPEAFKASVQNSDWYLSNDEYARTAWAQETLGGKDWETTLQNARIAVQDAALGVGADLTGDEINALARRYVYEGWNESTRQQLLQQALAEEITFVPDERGVGMLRGGAGDLQEGLRAIAQANGLSYTDNYYLSAAKSVMGGLSTANDWEREIREQAASMFPIYGDKIRAGANAYDLASPYISMMADELEIDRFGISLTDPYIRQALGGTDDQGNFTSMSLWEFQKKLRNDPRWMNTNKAQNEISSMTARVMEMFGLVG